MKLRYPSIEQFIESNFDTGANDVKTTMDMVSSCIDMIYSEEETWESKDSTKKEFEEPPIQPKVYSKPEEKPT